MRPNEEHVLKIDELRGIDLSTSPYKMSPKRAAFLKNFVKDSGTLKKRHGWMERYDTDTEDRIIGMQLFKNTEVKHIVCVLKNSIVRINLNKFGDAEKLYEAATPFETADFFFNRGKLYIITGNEYLVYGYFEDHAVYEIRTIEAYRNLGELYVPTTTIGIPPFESGAYVGNTFEGVNMLTKRRKNDLIANGQYSPQYILDSDIAEEDINDPDWTVFEVKKYQPDGTLIGTVQTYYVSGKVTASIMLDHEGNGAPIESVLKNASTSPDGEKTVFIDEEVKVTDTDGTYTIGAYVGDISNRRRVDFVTSKYPDSKILSATVEFDADTPLKENVIFNEKIGILFGTDGNNDRLFLAGNPNEKNIVRYSESNDFTYFPDTNQIIIGSEEIAVNAFSRLTDGALAILKEENSLESTIYYATGAPQVKTDAEGNILKIIPAFRIVAGSIGEGCINHLCGMNFNGDSVILTKNGVYGLTLSTNLNTNIRYAKRRSYLINSELTKSDLTKACATVYKNKYYIATAEGVMYAADGDSKFRMEDASYNAYEYEWERHEGIPATCFEEVDGVLYFGTEKGRICRFDESYLDKPVVKLFSGEVSINADLGTLTISKAKYQGKSENDRILLNAIGRTPPVALLGEITYKGNLITCMNENAQLLHLGDKVLTTIVGHNYERMEVVAINRGFISRDRRIGVQIEVNSSIEGEGTADLYLPLDLMPLVVYPTEAEAGYHVFRIGDERHRDTPVSAPMDWPLRLSTYGGFSAESLHARLTATKNVEATWETPYLDFGTNLRNKTVRRMNITAETGGKPVKLSYQTARITGSVDGRGMSGFSFNDLDFFNLSFEGEFAATHTVRRHIRSFNYLKFTIESDTDEPCILHDFSANYTITNKIRGTK